MVRRAPVLSSCPGFGLRNFVQTFSAAFAQARALDLRACQEASASDRGSYFVVRVNQRQAWPGRAFKEAKAVEAQSEYCSDLSLEQTGQALVLQVLVPLNVPLPALSVWQSMHLRTETAFPQVEKDPRRFSRAVMRDGSSTWESIALQLRPTLCFQLARESLCPPE